MKQTFKISFSLRNTYFANSFLYSFKQIPLLGKVIPQSIYGVEGIKILTNILSLFKELYTTFFNKFLYVLVMVVLPMSILDPVQKNAAFVHIILFLTLTGVLVNTGVFHPSKDKYYAVILMRMNANQYAVSDYIYRSVKIIVGMLPFVIGFGLGVGVPLWILLLIPFFIPAAKAIYIFHALRQFIAKGKCMNENSNSGFVWIMVIVFTVAAYLFPGFGAAVPVTLAGMLMALTIVVSIPSFMGILHFSAYREMLQELLQERRLGIDVKVTKRNMQIANSKQNISEGHEIISKKSGFEYFNELFIKRHKKVLWRPVLIVTIVAVIIWVAALSAILYVPAWKEKINHVLLTMLPYFAFIMYMINRGTKFTTVLFMNCDHSMLTYNYYKKPAFILKLFQIRLREIIKMNLLPAAVIAGGATTILYFTGGTDQPLNYVIIPVTILALSIFFSVHYLTWYYLLQPYTIETEMKSKAYSFIMSITYIITFTIMSIQIPTFVFGLSAIAFCAAYCVIACVLVYLFASKTFRLRS